MTYLYIVLVALFFSFFGIKLFKKFKILDRPWPDLPPRDRVPTMQWFFMVIWFFVSMFMFYPEYFSDKRFLGFLVWAWVLFVITLFDEILRFDNFKTISPKVRLLCQIFSVLAIFFIGWVWIYDFVLPNSVQLIFPWYLALFLTIIWFWMFMNAINWFDWVYGLASWVSSIWFLTIFLLIKFVVLKYYVAISALNYENLQIVLNLSFTLFVFSAIYAFIEFKPLWLLRDIWVMFLWFSLAYLALLGWAKIWTLLVVLSLAIFDAVWVSINRIKNNKNPLKWDFTHLHHRLLALKWNRSEIRVFIWWWSLFLMILMILQWANRFNKLIIFWLMFLIFFWTNLYLFWIKKMPWEYKVKRKDK